MLMRIKKQLILLIARNKIMKTRVTRKFIVALLGLLLFSFAVAAQTKGKKPATSTFNIVAGESSFTVFVAKDGALARLAHDHNMGVKTFSGKVTIQNNNPSASTLELDADARSLVILDQISAKDKAEITNNMNNSVLESAKFPKIAFRSTSISNFTQNGTNASFTVNGDLTLHGATKRIAIPVNVAQSGASLRATGTYMLRQTDFGIKPYSAFLGAIKIKNEVVIKFNIVAK
jgi:polyisoprenoid-binding protein YceI